MIHDGEKYDVDVDILAGIYGGTASKKRSQHVQGIKALKATGGNFAFEFPPQQVKIQAERVDGAIDSAVINVVAVVPYMIMKTAAMGRGKAKDVSDFMDLMDDEEMALIKRDAYEQVQALIERI